MASLLALEGQWNDFRAVLVVLTAAIALIGGPYIILSSSLGLRQAFHVLMVALFGFVTILSAIWLFGAPGTIPGTGPRGTEPTWVPFLASSEQGQQFKPLLDHFPSGWDAPGKKYPGGIDSSGEIESAKSIILDGLVRYSEFNGLQATSTGDWDFRPAGKKPDETTASLPEARVGFLQQGSALLLGATIPPTAKHREFTVFAFRDKGKVFLPAAIFLGVAVVLFAVNVAALARLERKQKERASRTVEPVAP